MKALCLSIGLFAHVALWAQPQHPVEPFVISGKVDNLAKKEMILFFKDKQKGYKDYTIDTIQAADDGSFYLKTYRVSQPTFATLRTEGMSVDLFAAPGYQLRVTGDARSMETFRASCRVSGTGAGTNRYLQLLDSILFADRAAKDWYEMNRQELLAFAKKDRRMKDSLHRVVFGRPNTKDPWQARFARMAAMDAQALNTYYIMTHALLDTSLNYTQTKAFANANLDKSMMANLFNEAYLDAPNYQGWLMGTYSEYLRVLAVRKDSLYATRKATDLQVLDQIAAHYKGKIREIRLYRQIDQAITYCRSFEELNKYKKDYPAYIKLLPIRDQQRFDSLMVAMEGVLLTTQVGKAAPLFAADDSTGKSYNLSDFKGRVIYLDLWASWCAPCRAETPHLKSLIEKYKADSNMTFVSIAVLDKYDNWKKALQADRPTWLQLFGTNSKVQNAYVANSIPKFVVIDKKGNIVSFDAPFPSSGEQLEKLLDQEIAR